MDTYKPLFCVISSSEMLTQLFVGAARQKNYRLIIRGGELEDAINAAKDSLADNPDVILSKNGTAEYVRNVVDIPVVSIGTSALDVQRALLPHARTVKKVAIFSYANTLFSLQLVAEALGVTIDEYVFYSHQDLVVKIMLAAHNGAELILGGILTVGLAREQGLQAELVTSGEDSIMRALDEALNIAQIRRIMRMRTARLETILHTIAEGIVVTDACEKVIIANSAALKFLGIESEELLCHPLSEVLPSARSRAVMESGLPEMGEIVEYNQNILITNWMPIMVGNKSEGVVCSITDVQCIQHVEQVLRGHQRHKDFQSSHTFESLITTSPKMLNVKELAKMYALTDATVLIQGDSGTGKELLAQSIHAASTRNAGPFVTINCAAIPEALLANELFGNEESAHTGVRQKGKMDLVEMAHEGTLFLDEVSELTMPLQARLLRVLQEREIVREGSKTATPVNIRVICATRRPLEDAIRAGSFRTDLYYRLNVLSLTIPALTERPEDILFIGHALLNAFLQRYQRPILPFEQFQKHFGVSFLNYSWPGNVRELASVMERVALVVHLMPKVVWKDVLERVWNMQRNEGDMMVTVALHAHEALKQHVKRFEQEVINYYSKMHNNNITKVAKELGMSRMSLWRRFREETAEKKV